MKKQLTEKIVYQPNDNIKVTVSNKPIYDDGDLTPKYERKVTIAVTCGYSLEKMTFADEDSLAEFLANVDVTDAQQSLFNQPTEE